MNILSVGNSFSQNAHRFMPGIFASGGEEILLCNLYIGGCSLETHWNNWRKEEPSYTYEIYLPGEREKRCPDDVALHEAVEDEQWDFITLQQCSPLSGVESSYFPYLSELAEYCRMVSPDAEVMLHQTWAYAADCREEAFERYNGSQNEMYARLTEAYRLASINSGIEKIIPSGKAWQFARGTVIGDNLTQPDGFHGNDFGCYLAGACFYEMMTGRSAAENSFCIPGVSEEIMQLLRICAHLACEEGIFQ